MTTLLSGSSPRIAMWQIFGVVAVASSTLAAEAQSVAGGGPQPHPAPASRPSMQALRVSAPVIVDGVLDDSAWSAAHPISDFLQVNPGAGIPSAFRTEVRVVYDERNLYIGAFMRDTSGTGGLRVPDVRRDFDFNLHDQFGVVLFPQGGRQVSFVFALNPYGAQRDQQVVDGTRLDLEWDGLWYGRTTRTDSGWVAEFAIPWSTLRYQAGDAAWLVNFYRRARAVNELSGWTPWPRAQTPYHAEYAGVLEGIDAPPGRRDLRMTPYVVARATRERPGPGAVTEPQIGGDIKWLIDPTTVLDVTLNTDFAEADVDRPVLNLSRFNVRFPERRAFFLENSALFTTASSPTVQPFFTRMVGLDATGLPLRIHGGARIVRQSSAQGVGTLLVHQDGAAGSQGTTLGVARLHRLVRRHRAGLLGTVRMDHGAARHSVSATVAADAQLLFSPQTRGQMMLAATHHDGESARHGIAATGWLGRTSNAGYLGWLQHVIGRGFDPAVGFVYARDVVLTSPAARLDMRPNWLPRPVREVSTGTTLYMYHRASDLAFREAWVDVDLLSVLFHTGAAARLRYRPEWQHLERSFSPLPGLTIQPGHYRYGRASLELATDPSARLTGSVQTRAGTFWDGRTRGLDLTFGYSPSPFLSAGAGWSVTALEEVGTDSRSVTTHMVVPTARVAFSPRLQLTGFAQYNTAANQLVGNARLAWEYRPLSYVYLVFNERAALDPLNGRLDREAIGQRQLLLKANLMRQW